MKQELGKWLMDIAKYITTAVLLTSTFSHIENGVMSFVLAVSAIALTLVGGLILIKSK